MSNNAHPPRLKRSESFLGVHFDFHAGKDCTEVGKRTTREMIEHIIDAVQPDYLQCDCKGHPGISSYPTKVGNPAPGFVGDPLRVWREVTAERGVSLFMHYSGVWDNEAVAQHPEWARVDAEGQPDKRITSVFGPYEDELLIPQLKELALEYGVDGAWVDGECWATEPDWSEKALAAFRQETGIQEVPRKPEDPHYAEFVAFCREGFRRYLQHYLAEVHQAAPNFQIASNWAYTSFMPEPVTTDVDYISGDYTAQNSVNSARLEARCIAHQGKPWDLMAWSFGAKWGEGGWSTKSVPQLQQEAAIVLSLGGGFQAYFTQKRDGSISRWQMDLMREVAKFCRDRQEFCHRGEPVPQIALVYAGKAFYHQTPRVFAPWHGELDPMRGVLQSLLEAQLPVEILMEHHLTGHMADYPLIVVPEWEYLEPGFREELLAYVRDGGHLLVIGPKAAAMFAEQLQVRFTGELQEDKVHYLEHNGWLAAMKTPFQAVELGAEARPFGKLYGENDNIGPYDVAASIANYGQGQIAATYLNLGERYLHAGNAVARDFLSDLVRALFPNPIVTVSGSHQVDVAVSRVNDKLTVHLVNTSGPHANPEVYVYDDIPAVGPLEVTVRVDEEPRFVTLQPSGRKVAYIYEDGAVKVILPRLEIYDILVID